MKYATPYPRRLKLKVRRDELRRLQKCINGPIVGSVGKRHGIEHGPVVDGNRCARCRDLYLRTRD